MKKLDLESLPTLGSMKPVLLALILSTVFMLDLSASQTDNDEKVIKHDDKNQFTFPRWKSLHKLNTEALESNAHRAWFDMYVNTLAKKAYVEKLSLFPVGSIVLKPLYPDSQRSETAKLTIMIKMEKGYDTENGDWWYGVYDESGREGKHQGKIQSCIKCHTIAKETDYMFSESTMESINEEEW
jgi:hypothetical protein